MIKLSINSTPYFKLLPEHAGREEQFITFLESLDEIYGEVFGWSLNLSEKNCNSMDLLELLRLELMTSFTIEEAGDEAFLMEVMDLQPTELCFDFPLMVKAIPHKNAETKLWKVLGERTLLIKQQKIKFSVKVEDTPDAIIKAGSIGADKIVLASITEEGTFEEQAHLAKVAVDLGMEVGIQIEGREKVLKSALEQIPHLTEVSVGRCFFSTALALGIEGAFASYSELLRNY